MSLIRAWQSITNRFKILTLPDGETIDLSGVIRSDHPVAGNGWIKGWVVKTFPRDIIIVRKHANPSTAEPNNKVFARDSQGRRVERTIVAIDNAPFKLDGKSADITEHPYQAGGDIAICRVNKPFPTFIKAYEIATNPDILYNPARTLRQDGSLSTAYVFTMEELAWVIGRKRASDQLLAAGDSGLPWFVWEGERWKVVTHTTKGQWGEGPWYGSPLMLAELNARIQAMHAK